MVSKIQCMSAIQIQVQSIHLCNGVFTDLPVRGSTGSTTLSSFSFSFHHSFLFFGILQQQKTGKAEKDLTEASASITESVLSKNYFLGIVSLG